MLLRLLGASWERSWKLLERSWVYGALDREYCWVIRCSPSIMEVNVGRNPPPSEAEFSRLFDINAALLSDSLVKIWVDHGGSWAVLGPSWGRLGSLLGSSWGVGCVPGTMRETGGSRGEIGEG